MADAQCILGKYLLGVHEGICVRLVQTNASSAQVREQSNTTKHRGLPLLQPKTGQMRSARTSRTLITFRIFSPVSCSCSELRFSAWSMAAGQHAFTCAASSKRCTLLFQNASSTSGPGLPDLRAASGSIFSTCFICLQPRACRPEARAHNVHELCYLDHRTTALSST